MGSGWGEINRPSGYLDIEVKKKRLHYLLFMWNKIEGKMDELNEKMNTFFETERKKEEWKIKKKL